VALGLATATTVTAGVAAAVPGVALGSAATGVSVAALARVVADAVGVGWIVVAEALAGIGEAVGVSVAAAVG
jgi:hypothetical protein